MSTPKTQIKFSNKNSCTGLDVNSKCHRGQKHPLKNVRKEEDQMRNLHINGIA
jgi:hypothetical protein